MRFSPRRTTTALRLFRLSESSASRASSTLKFKIQELDGACVALMATNLNGSGILSETSSEDLHRDSQDVDVDNRLGQLALRLRLLPVIIRL